MNIDWAAFGQVFVVSFGASVGVIVLFAIGVTVLSRAPASAGRSDGGPDAVAATASSSPIAQLAAGLCFLACALTVLFGLYVIISK